MKRIFRVLTVPVLISLLLMTVSTACSRQKDGDQDNDSVEILATFYPIYVMLMNITENIPGVSVSMLAPADTGCLHDYQLTTKDMRAIESCDILVVNGAGMEDFFDKALSLKSGSTVIAGEGFKIVDGNPHIWVSLDGAMYQVAEIAAGLSKLDPRHSDGYMENAANYVGRLVELSVEMHSRLDRYRGKRIVTFHEAFPYFASEFGLELAAVIEREPGTDPSAKELRHLVDMVKGMDADGKTVSLFAEPQYSSSAAEIIAMETGRQVWELDPCVTGNLEKGAYIQAMKKNMEILLEAFKE